MEAILTVQC